MTRNLRGFLGLFSIFALVGLSGASSCGQVKKNDNIISSKTPIVKTKGGGKAGGGCVRGRVVDEDNKGFVGVYVNTNPASSLQVTDSFGNFEICHARKVINKDTGETAKIGLPHLTYKLTVKKDGFKARAVDFTYTGKTVRLTRILMVANSKPLPDVVKKKTDDDLNKKKDSGSLNRGPKSE
jgi:hypothetical protein